MEINTVLLSLEKYHGIIDDATEARKELNRLISSIKDKECVEYATDFFGLHRTYYYNLDDIKERIRKELYEEIKREVRKEELPNIFGYLKRRIKGE
jgi:hypothetical protein